MRDYPRSCWICGRGLEAGDKVTCYACPDKMPIELIQYIQANPMADARVLYSKIAGSQMGVEWYSIQYQFQAAAKEIAKLANSGFYSSGYLAEKLDKVQRYSQEWYQRYAHVLSAYEKEVEN